MEIAAIRRVALTTPPPRVDRRDDPTGKTGKQRARALPLRPPRPPAKLGDPRARAPAAEELCRCRGGECVGGNRRQGREHGLTHADFDVLVPSTKRLCQRNAARLYLGKPTKSSSEAADNASVIFARSSASTSAMGRRWCGARPARRSRCRCRFRSGGRSTAAQEGARCGQPAAPSCARRSRSAR